MKNLFNIKLVCPFCKEEINHNILNLKAKHECEHCKNDLIIRTKMIASTIISVIGFMILFALLNLLGISELGKIPTVIFLWVGCILYLSVAYGIFCKVFGPNKLYAVDAMDPVLLKRYKKKK